MTHCHFQYATEPSMYLEGLPTNFSEHQHLNDDKGQWIPKDPIAYYIASTTLQGGNNYIGTLEMNTHLLNITLL